MVTDRVAIALLDATNTEDGYTCIAGIGSVYRGVTMCEYRPARSSYAYLYNMVYGRWFRRLASYGSDPWQEIDPETKEPTT